MRTLLYLSDGYLIAMFLWVVAGVVSLWLLLRQRRRVQAAEVDPSVREKSLRWIHAGLSVWMLLLLLTLPELAFALFYDQTDSYSLTTASQRWFDLHVVTNEDGFRDDRPYPDHVPEDAVHLCFAGDSFTFGHGVRDAGDRFTNRIRQQLDQQSPGRFLVSNTGLPGVDIRMLQDALLPDLEARGVPIDVLVYVFVPNDIEYLDERSGAFYQSISDLQPGFFLFRDTFFYNWLYFRWQGMRHPALQDYYAHLEDAYTGSPWQRMTERLEQLRETCREQDTELQIVVFPFLHRITGETPFTIAHDKMAAFCREQDIPCVDLAPILKKHADQPLVVNAFDAHPNERAHEIAAEAILEQLSGRWQARLTTPEKDGDSVP